MPVSTRPTVARAKGEETPQLSRWEHLAKLAIADYLNSCLTGDYKTFFNRFAPYSKKWVVKNDVSWVGEDPLEQAVSIARYYERTPGAPPQVLIRTTGHTPVPQNLGSFSHGSRSGDTSTVCILDEATVPIELACTALDQDESELLVHFVETAFGPKCRYTTNYLLVPNDMSRRTWSVRLPLTWSVGGPTDVPLGEDRQQRLWTQTVSQEVHVEVASWSTYESKIDVQYDLSETLAVSVPSSVKVGSATPLYITSKRPVGSRWIVSDFRLALITENESLFAKKAGTITLSLLDSITGDALTSSAIAIVP